MASSFLFVVHLPMGIVGGSRSSSNTSVKISDLSPKPSTEHLPVPSQGSTTVVVEVVDEGFRTPASSLTELADAGWFDSTSKSLLDLSGNRQESRAAYAEPSAPDPNPPKKVSKKKLGLKKKSQMLSSADHRKQYQQQALVNHTLVDVKVVPSKTDSFLPSVQSRNPLSSAMSVDSFNDRSVDSNVSSHSSVIVIPNNVDKILPSSSDQIAAKKVPPSPGRIPSSSKQMIVTEEVPASPGRIQSSSPSKQTVGPNVTDEVPASPGRITSYSSNQLVSNNSAEKIPAVLDKIPSSSSDLFTNSTITADELQPISLGEVLFSPSIADQLSLHHSLTSSHSTAIVDPNVKVQFTATPSNSSAIINPNATEKIAATSSSISLILNPNETEKVTATPSSILVKRTDDADDTLLKRTSTKTLTFSDSKQPVQPQSVESIVSEVTAEEGLRRMLAAEVEKSCWQECEVGPVKCWQITFIAKAHACDKLISLLTAMGIGRIEHSSLSVFPSNYFLAPETTTVEEVEVESKVEQNDHSHPVTDFIKSIRSRLAVATVLGEIKDNAILTFDFIIFMMLASFVAAVGLFEDSAITIVASMLIAPGEMGPIIAFAFGVMMRSAELCRVGARNELLGVSLSVIFGYLCGFVVSLLTFYNNTHWGGPMSSWPTNEMKSRGMLRGLWVGCLTAIPAGTGVALAILGGKSGTLVGVAISASLIGPAVNAGAMWGLATFSTFMPPALERPLTDTDTPPNCPPMVNNRYEFIYDCSFTTEVLILGAISLTLTILNVFCLFLMSVVILKIKEVTPQFGKETEADTFWKTHIPHARKHKKKAQDVNQITKEFMENRKSSKGQIDGDPTLQRDWVNVVQTLDDEIPAFDDLVGPNNAGSRRSAFAKRERMHSLYGASLTLNDEISSRAPAPRSASDGNEQPKNVVGKVWGWMSSWNPGSAANDSNAGRLNEGLCQQSLAADNDAIVNDDEGLTQQRRAALRTMNSHRSSTGSTATNNPSAKSVRFPFLRPKVLRLTNDEI